MAENSEYVLKPLREGAEFTLYRGRERGNEFPILAVAVAAEQPSPQSLRRLEHEYSLTTELDAAWAAQPLALARHHGRVVLILKDPGGEPLDVILKRDREPPLDLAGLLRIAIGMAMALGHVHQRGLIHKDVKPGNVLVDDAGHVWLTGFGIASRLPRERQTPAPPEIIAGTLAYISPEQTGRMNRSMDSRSDLYSLGVTLYQILTGALPFVAADPLEWIHCHIARQPTAPADRCTVPKPLSDLIMRLLAKNAEERYQTAAGVEADLRRCLTEWQSHGRIDGFTLGADDSSERLLIPERLYGREHEVDTLLAAFDRVVVQGTAELVLVSGYSGVGKSSVVNELHKVLVQPRGLFAAGKFDQYKRDVPYATLAQAFQTLVRQILVKSEAQVDHWRHALLDELGPNGQLMVNLIPELEFVIGKQPPVAELPPQEARNRFQLVFRRFLGAFATAEHPLALFLDDLQWLDTATLELLERLITDADVRHVLLIGAYRDNEVSSSDPLMRTLAAIRDAGAKTEEIVLAPLRLDDVERLIADALHCGPNSAGPLALLVQEKTGGNPFFAIQLLTSLAEEGLLRFDRAAAGWIWDLGRIRAKGYTDNVVDLMVEKLLRLSGTTQAALQQLACLGNAPGIEIISMVFRQSEEEIHTTLLEAARTGLILRREGSYAFLHDRIQEATYSLIADEVRAEAHLRIGRLLYAYTPPERLEEAIFEIVNQLNRGGELVASEDERLQLAELNLIAGKRARASSAYASALQYFIAGETRLTNDCRERRKGLTFQLEWHRAEGEFLVGKPADAAKRLEILRSRASNIVELAMATCLVIDVYVTLYQIDHAVALCLDYLRHLGIDWPFHPTDEEARAEYERIWSLLGSREIEEVMDLPLMRDPDSIATLDVLTRVLPAALFTDSNLVAMVICRAISLSIERGNSDGSCIAYVFFIKVAGPHFGNYGAGFRFGQLGYELVEKRGLDRFKARTCLWFAEFVMPWTKHVQACRGLIRRALEAATTAGDLTVVAYCFNNLNTNFLTAGDPLAETQRQAEDGLEFAERMQFAHLVDVIATQLGLIRTLRGLTYKFGCFDDGHLSETLLEQHFAGNPAPGTPECWYWIRKLQARFFAGDYPSALDAAARVRPILWRSAAMFETAEYHFYAALSHAASCASAVSSHDCHISSRPADDGTLSSRPRECEQHLESLAAHHRQLEAWAENCRETFENRAALVGAELARIEGRELDAERLYERAINSAHENDFVHNEALASEIAAQFYAARGLNTVAYAYLRNARNCYHHWGASGKVKQLDELYPRLRQERTQASAAIAEPAVQLDVESVVKASQAISSEVVLPKLIEKLVRIAIEHAGAERGLLILIRNGEPRIELEATTSLGGIEVIVRHDPVAPSDLPQSALHYVTRTHETVLLDDASTDKVYSKDEYVERKRVKSVLCLPIVKQKKLVGAFYLENNLTSGAFTPDRVTVLQLLASQAAISLENAALYTDLQLQVGLLQRLPVSAWTLEPDGTPDFVNQGWLEFSGQTLDFVQSHPEAWMTAVHPADREIAAKSFWEGVHSGQDFAFETRSLRDQDGKYRWQLQQAVVLRDAEGKVLKFIGTTTDIDNQKRAEEALRQAQGDLARINRVTTMGELAASLAHEISQPISGVITNTNVCLRKLGHDEPDLDEVRTAVTRIGRDAQRAAEIIGRIRSQFEKGALDREVVDLNEINRETVALLRDEAMRHNISVRTELAADLPQIVGDRVQLQQVAMNLIVNSIEAMKDVDGIRELVIKSQRAEDEQVLVSFSDTGVGLPPQLTEQIFDPFFTTKLYGTGMGLRISRSIIESHGGRLWAVGSHGRGATFHLNLPAAIPGHG